MMDYENPGMDKYIIFVEFGCPLSLAGGEPVCADEWRVFESEGLPETGWSMNESCGPMRPFESCDEEGMECHERGIIRKVEPYTSERAMQLGIGDYKGLKETLDNAKKDWAYLSDPMKVAADYVIFHLKKMGFPEIPSDETIILISNLYRAALEKLEE